MSRPSGPRRIVVKNPVARVRSAGGQRLDPRLDLRLRRAGGIEVGLRRLRRRARHERLVLVEARPRPLVDQEVVQPRAAELGGVAARSVSSMVRCPPTPGGERARRRPSPPRRAWPAPAARSAAAPRVGGEVNRREARRHGLKLLAPSDLLVGPRSARPARCSGSPAPADHGRRDQRRLSDRLHASVHSGCAGAGLERGRIGAEAPNRRFPHLFRRHAEDQRRIDGHRQPRRRRELLIELPGPQPA